MNKFLVLVVMSLLIMGCNASGNKKNALSSQHETQDETKKEKKLEAQSQMPNSTREALATELLQATTNKDYRLYVTSGRSITVPGIKPTEFKEAIARCGKKYRAGTGDVISNEAQRNARTKQLSYMRLYNQSMWLLCDESSTENVKRSNIN
ncbi:MAG: hypothetical protein OCD00_17165 [Colwellia sp.]